MDKEEKMEIKVLGPGCQRCQQTEAHVKQAVAEAGIHAQVEKVADVMEISKYGVFGTPAVIIDGEVKCVGRVPNKQEIKDWMAAAGVVGGLVVGWGSNLIFDKTADIRQKVGQHDVNIAEIRTTISLQYGEIIRRLDQIEKK